MKQFMKNRKAIAFVLLIAMMFSIMPTAVWASESETGDLSNKKESLYLYSDTVLAKTTTASALMENIADKYETDSYEWAVMDMAAYAEYNSATSHKTTVGTKQEYMNKTISSIAQDTPLKEAEYAKAIIILTALGVDPTQLYPMNSNTPVNAVAELNALIDESFASEDGYVFNAWVTPYTVLAYQQGNYGGDRVDALITATVKAQNSDGSWDVYSPVQATPTVITSLARYKENNQSVSTAISKAVQYLSDKQLSNGRFKEDGDWYPLADSNTSSMVLIGLAAAGINPDKDERFMKSSKSALEGLLDYAFADHTGFGYQNNQSDLWGTSTEQGFRALIAASQVMKTGEAFNIYDFSSNTLEPGRATGSGAVQKPSTPSGNTDITVTVSIKGLDGYWLKDKKVTLKDDATMYWALVDAIADTNITQTGAESGYVSEMSKGTTTLAEFDYGRNSGWLYKVGNTLPEVGLLEYTVKNGDVIEWYYTRDWTTDSLAGARVDNADKQAAAKVDELLDKLLDKVGNLDDITAEDAETIAEIRKAYDALTDEQKALVENYDDLVAAETLLAELLAAPEALPFADTENHWAQEAIQFVYDNGLLRGVSETEFAPEATFSRAMLAAVLHRMAGNPAASGYYPFTDVRDTAWYASPVAWAYQNKLAGGMTETQYAPNSPITREQLAVMLMRFAQYQGYDTSDTIRLVHYQDAGLVSGYAEPAVKWAVSTGLLKGRTSNELQPQGTATRAEVAVILQRFLAMYEPVATSDIQ